MPGTVPPVSDERSGLLAFLAQQREAVIITAHGLTDDEARQTPTAGTLSIGGLVKHVAAMERGWMDTLLQREGAGQSSSYEDDFTLKADETLAEVIASLEAAGRETEAIIAGIEDLGQAVPVPKGVPWFPQDVEAWSVRWVLLHLIEELGRHAGHADIVRESIDGATTYELLAAHEGWPATEWMQPWERKEPVAC